jgi:hypothetical protein
MISETGTVLKSNEREVDDDDDDDDDGNNNNNNNNNDNNGHKNGHDYKIFCFFSGCLAILM